MLAWILIPVIFVIPGGLLLNWFSAIEFLSPYRNVYAWVPFPFATIFLILIIWPLKRWIQRVKQENEIESEMDDILHSTDATIDIG